MLLVPFFISVIMIIIVTKFDFRGDILITGISVTWTTFFGLWLIDIIGTNMSWW